MNWPVFSSFGQIVLTLSLATSSLMGQSSSIMHTWMADNGNGTFSNPLFYEEFSDPDLIRVGDDYYMTGTTMHTMPGLPILHSVDLVNWELLSYAVERLDLGPELRLEEGKEFYGRGIWAPCIRYHDDTFYIFSNVNGHGTQLFSATDPRGPWTHQQMKVGLHDLSVLFDDDGKIYAVWGYDEVKLVELTKDLLDTIPGSSRVIVEAGRGAGEGCHFYKIDGKYFITNTNYDPACYQVCLRSSHPEGPYEIKVISAEENMGIAQKGRIWNTRSGPPYAITEYPANYVGCIPMHQGGIVETQTGEWWGWSMMDFNAIGRVTALSPVTWVDNWPMLGLEGNLTRSPRTWIKPNTGNESEPRAPFQKDDEFDGPVLANAWQWNHVPVENKWSLEERPGYLRLHALAAPSFWMARNTLTQRGVGPESSGLVELDVAGLRNGDVAGLALLNLPYAWLGIEMSGFGKTLVFHDQQRQQFIRNPLEQNIVWLKVDCDFEEDKAMMSYSLDGEKFTEIGGEILMPYQLKTFQGTRYALFNFNQQGVEGGYADFNYFHLEEPRFKALTRPIPFDKNIRLINIADSLVLVNYKNLLRPVPADSPLAQGDASLFKVVDRGQGRVALQSVSTHGFVTVQGLAGIAEVRIETDDQGAASTFQWQDMLRDDLMLMSLYSHRYLFVQPNSNNLCSADARGARPDRKGGACFRWQIVSQ